MGTAPVALSRAFAGHSRIAVDAVPLIYFVTGDPRRAPVTRALFSAAAAGRVSIVASVVTELELLVGPIRREDSVAIQLLDQLLSGPPAVEVMECSREVARAAASVRADHNLSLPDSVVAATALVSGCTALLANDGAFRRIADRLAYLHVDDLAPR